MKWFNFDTVYVNGSSLSAGGGLEVQDVKRKYKELYDITYEDEKLVTYGKYVADHFDCEFINEAKSGSGSPRLIRKTYEYIEKVGLKKARKTLFIFEIQDPTHRVDLYCEKIQDYLTVNVRYDNSDSNLISSIQIQSLTTDTGRYFGQEYFRGEITNDVKSYLEKYHNPVSYCEKIDGDLVGLFSFLNESDITYFFMFDQGSLKVNYQQFYKKNSFREIKIDYKRCINDFCGDNNLTIRDELNGFTPDTHPGYFGNKKYSEKLIEFLTLELKPKIYAFGDSFTQSFSDHFNTTNPWAVKYHKYKNYIPKNYVDLLSERLEIDNVNLGKGGCSNYTIFDTFIQNFSQIKQKDILLFNWTSESRFRISDDANNFIDITPFNKHPSQNKFVSKTSTEEIGKNKITNNVWWREISDKIDIISNLLPKNKILHWTWVDPSNQYQEDLWSEEMKNDKKLCLDIRDWEAVEEELKKIIINCSDLLVDFSKEVDHNKFLEILEKKQKVVIINTNFITPDNKIFMRENLRCKHLNLTNHKKLCYKKLLKYKKYQTISEETDGVVDDLHYSEKGHIDLSIDLFHELNKKYQ